MARLGARKSARLSVAPDSANQLQPTAAQPTAAAAAARIEIAGNPASSKRELWRLAMRIRKGRAIGRALGANPNCPRTLMWLFARRGAWDVAAAIAANANCPRRVQATLARSQYWAVRASLAANPAARQEMLLALSRSYMAAPQVSLGLATNPSLDTGLVDSLLRHENRYVRRVAAAHPAASAAGLARLGEGLSEPAWTLRAIAANPSCPADLSDQLLTWLALGGPVHADPIFDPVACTGHPADTRSSAASWYAQQAEDLWASKHALWRVRAAITSPAGQLPADQVRLLSRDPRTEVRRTAVRLRGAPISVVVELSDDADSQVAGHADLRVKASPKAVSKYRRRIALRLRFSPLILVVIIGFQMLGQHLSGSLFGPDASRTHVPAGTTTPGELNCTPGLRPDGGSPVGMARTLPGGGQLLCGSGHGAGFPFIEVITGDRALVIKVLTGTVTLAGRPVADPLRLASGKTSQFHLPSARSTVVMSITPRSGAKSVFALNFGSRSR